MKIVHKDYKFVYDIKENDKCILVIESAKIFRSLITDIQETLLSNDGKFVISENNDIVKASEKIELVINPMDISINTRKTISKLNEKIKREINNTELLITNNELCMLLEKYALSILETVDLECTYNDKLDVPDLIKILDLHFVENYENQEEKIIEYIKIYNELFGIKNFFFINMYAYFDQYEIDEIYKYADYNKINIILFESKQPKELKYYNKAYIIDEDGCEINLSV